MMADGVFSNVTPTELLLQSPGNTEENTCRRCNDSETQLKEALNELSSAQTIINILQNELILAIASTSVNVKNRTHSEPETEVWKLVT
jgi:hypothetical protein